MNNSSSSSSLILSFTLSMFFTTRLLQEVGFLTIPLPEPMPILMIDHSPLDCGEREDSKPQREREKKKRRGRKERRGQSHKVRVMSSLLFSAVRSVACASRERTGGVTGGLAGTDVLTQ